MKSSFKLYLFLIVVSGITSCKKECSCDCWSEHPSYGKVNEKHYEFEVRSGQDPLNQCHKMYMESGNAIKGSAQCNAQY